MSARPHSKKRRRQLKQRRASKRKVRRSIARLGITGLYGSPKRRKPVKKRKVSGKRRKVKRIPFVAHFLVRKALAGSRHRYHTTYMKLPRNLPRKKVIARVRSHNYGRKPRGLTYNAATGRTAFIR